MVDDVQDGRLDQLRLHDRRNDLDERLSREDQRSLGDAVDITRELEVREIVQEVGVKGVKAPKVLDILAGEVQLIEVLDQLLHAAHDAVAAAERVDTEKRVEDDGLVLILVLEITLHHRQLIEVGEQRQILSVHCFSSFLPQKCGFTCV